MEWAPSGFRGFQGFDFGQDSGGFSFHADAHCVIVCLGEFAGLELKVQVAQVFVDHVLAFLEIGRAGLLRAGFSVTAGKKNIDEHAHGKNAAKNLDQDDELLRTHISVSWWAWVRKASSFGSRLRSAGDTVAVRIFQL